MLAIDHRATISILAGQRILAGQYIKQAAKVAGIHGLSVEFVAQAQIQCESPRDFPIVLHENARVNATLPPPIEHWRPLCESRVTQQEIGKRQSRASRVGTGGESRAVDLVAKKRRTLQSVEALAANVGTRLQSVLAMCPTEIVGRLKPVLNVEIGVAATPTAEFRGAGLLSGIN